MFWGGNLYHALLTFLEFKFPALPLGNKVGPNAPQTRESRLECKEQHASHRARRALSLVERRDSGVQDSRRTTNHLIGFSSKTRPWNSKTKRSNKQSQSVDLGPRPLSCYLRFASLRVTLSSCELRSRGEEGEDPRSIIRQPCFT